MQFDRYKTSLNDLSSERSHVWSTSLFQMWKRSDVFAMIITSRHAIFKSDVPSFEEHIFLVIFVIMLVRLFLILYFFFEIKIFTYFILLFMFLLYDLIYHTVSSSTSFGMLRVEIGFLLGLGVSSKCLFFICIYIDKIVNMGTLGIDVSQNSPNWWLLTRFRYMEQRRMLFYPFNRVSICGAQVWESQVFEDIWSWLNSDNC